MDNQEPVKIEEKKKVSTKVKCPDCGKEFEIEVEIPEAEETPKMAWTT